MQKRYDNETAFIEYIIINCPDKVGVVAVHAVNLAAMGVAKLTYNSAIQLWSSFIRVGDSKP